MGVFVITETDGTRLAIRSDAIARIERSNHDAKTEIHTVDGMWVYYTNEDHKDAIERWSAMENGMMQEVIHPVLGNVIVNSKTLDALMREG